MPAADTAPHTRGRRPTLTLTLSLALSLTLTLALALTLTLTLALTLTLTRTLTLALTLTKARERKPARRAPKRAAGARSAAERSAAEGGELERRAEGYWGGGGTAGLKAEAERAAGRAPVLVPRPIRQLQLLTAAQLGEVQRAVP